MVLRRTLFILAALSMAGALGLLASDGYMKAKGALAAVLIDRAWLDERRDGRPHRPWAWADMHPVAQLHVSRLALRRPILTGAAGSSLAFGLGHVSGTPLPGEAGTSIVAGHRDTWGEFLEELRIGDVVDVETMRGSTRCTVERTEVVGKDRMDRLQDEEEFPRLALVTCWPFSGLRRTPWRYIVHCACSAPLLREVQPASPRTAVRAAPPGAEPAQCRVLGSP